MPFEIEASRSGFPPAGTIFTSFSGSMPRRRNDSRNPISEMLPKRLTEPIFPRNCSVVVMLAVLTIWSMKVGMIDRIITVSAAQPRIHHVGRGRNDDIEVTRYQRLHRGRTGAEKDGFDCQALLR